MMHEQRKEPRQRVLKVGKIVHNGLNSVYDCGIKDMSATGARLKMDSTWIVPLHFQFIDLTRPESRRPAKVVWRDRSQIGIRFEDGA
jgi:hypothetical protein